MEDTSSSSISSLEEKAVNVNDNDLIPNKKEVGTTLGSSSGTTLGGVGSNAQKNKKKKNKKKNAKLNSASNASSSSSPLPSPVLQQLQPKPQTPNLNSPKTKPKKTMAAIIHKANTKEPSRDPSSDEEDSSNSSGSEEDYSDGEDEGKEGYRKGGYHPVKIGQLYKNNRYEVLEKLGWGHFSTVWYCKDKEIEKAIEKNEGNINGRNQFVALKIVKSAKHYTEAAIDEIKILKRISQFDPQDKRCCVRLLDDFQHKGPNGNHVCMVFEVLGSNLLDLIKKYNYRGIPLNIVKSICYETLIGLEYLHTQCQVIHTDLKPENVLLYNVLPKKKKEKKSEEEEDVASDEDASEGEDEEGSKNSKDYDTIKDKNEDGNEDEDEDEEEQSKTSNSGKQETKDKENEEITKKVEELKLTNDDSKSQINNNSTSTSTSTSTSEAKPSVTVKDVSENDRSSYLVKIADFGNACWVNEHFTSDIQTRQYRAPEVILGIEYTPAVDMWSMGCMVFELITGDLLFEPKKGNKFDKNDDHLAQMIELLGRLPKSILISGKHSRDYFNRNGELKAIRSLKIWNLERVLEEKYRWTKEEAEELSSFILPMLNYFPEKRATATQMLKHKFLKEFNFSI